MKFEELETLWAAQPAAPAATIDLASLKQNLMPELKRRGRMIRYGIFMSALGLVLFPLLTIANYRFTGPTYAAWHWVDLAFWTVVNSVILTGLLRKARRQRAMIRQSAESVRALTTVSLTSREAEMEDFRRGLWVVPALLAFQLVSLYMKFPVTEHGWSPFAARAGATLVFTVLMSSVFWRHYQVNLKPDHARQRDILRDLA